MSPHETFRPDRASLGPDRDAEVVELGEIRPPSRGPGARQVVAAVLVSLFGLVLILRLPGGEPQASPASSVRPSAAAGSDRPVALSTASPGPSALPWAWTEHELRGYGRGSSVTNVWALDGLFVIEVETDEGPDGGPFGPVSSVLLASEDGVTWTDDRFDLPARGFVIDVGATGGGWLTVLGRPDSDSSRQAWISRDGSWRRLDDATAQGILEGRVDELAFTGCGGDRACAGASWGAVVGVEDSHEWEELLLSSDGIDWVRADLPLDAAASLTSLTVTSDTWYAVATQGRAGARPRATELLSSTDLVTWRAEQVALVQGGGRAMAIGLAGPVVVGSVVDEAGPSPRAWLRSTSGEWFAVEPPMAAGRMGASMDELIATAEGYVAMSSTTGDAWLSPDGVTWHNRPAFNAEPGDTVLGLATFGDVVVAGGRTASGRPAVWQTLLSEQFATLEQFAVRQRLRLP